MELKEKNLNLDQRTLHRMLKDKGYSVDRDKGKHTVWKHPSGKTIAVPRNNQGGSYSPGTSHQLLKTLEENEKIILGYFLLFVLFLFRPIYNPLCGREISGQTDGIYHPC